LNLGSPLLWSRIVEIPNFGSHRAKEKTVAAQPVVLKALSKIAFDLSFSNRRPADGAELYEKFLDGIEQIDFAHSNPMWRYYGMNAEEREAKGLSSMSGYLPDEAAGANRDIGSYQSGFMRFGAKHNDIYPILADMIRWKLGLPNRREP
jgi:DNA-sulfur modification-associated